ncbi:MAG: hypothetical protein R3E97_21270 [Candidatus Eisenbacteria bacterium]
MKDPSPHLSDLGIELASYSDPARPAVIDDAHLARVNYEIYYFADEKERISFGQHPRESCGIVTDPITKQRFRPGSSAPRMSHAERTWFFVSDSTRTLFAAMPDSFLSPRYSMKPKAAKS